MSIAIRWYDHQERILLEELAGPVSLVDYLDILNQRAALLSQKQHIVDIIADFTNSQTNPHDVMAAARIGETCLPPNLGKVIFVKPSSGVKTVVKLIKRLNFHTGEYLQIATNIDAALHIIHTTHDNRVALAN